MSRYFVVRFGWVACCLALLAGSATPSASAGTGAGGRPSRFVDLASVSCASAGNCLAGGWSGATAYEVSEVNGVWGSVRAVAGNVFHGRPKHITAVSCGSAGNCAAAGNADDPAANGQTFVVDEVRGTWRRAILIDPAGLGITSVSCPSAGNCVAGGLQLIGEENVGGFIAGESRGRWGVPFDPGFDLDGFATVAAVSCPSAGNCGAAGYGDSPFLLMERDGHWGSSSAVAGGLAGDVTMTSLSCAAQGECEVGGYYEDVSGKFQGFLIDVASGQAGPPITIPANRIGQADLTVSVSCGAPGNCAAGGSYTDAAGRVQGFVMNEIRGRWGTFRPVPGLAALNTGGRAYVTSVSCASAGNCAAGGAFTASSVNRAFVVSERNGRWGKAVALGLAGHSTVKSVSCGAPGNCAAAGTRFVVGELNGQWQKAILMRRPALEAAPGRPRKSEQRTRGVAAEGGVEDLGDVGHRHRSSGLRER
jgi:hypothetical protein